MSVPERSGAAPPKVLTFSTLYPNAAAPNHGVFVENRLRELAKTGAVEPFVVAPVPYFPSSHPVFGRWARHAAAPRAEVRHGIRVLHPRFPAIPKLGMHTAPFLLAAALDAPLRRLQRTAFDVDLIDAHYLYPDGVAAVLLGRRLGKPVVVTARGSDVNLIARHGVPARLIRWACRRAAGVVTVSEALRGALRDLGVDRRDIAVLRNGVDLDLFRPQDRALAKSALGLSGPVVASVGHLVPRKGHDLALRALRDLPEVTLLVVGDGPERARLVALAGRLGVSARVRFVGAVPHADMSRVYNAADSLVLASSREGLPNVVLESLACGTPVVASAVWGTPEIVTAPVAGRLVPERRPEAFASALRAALAEAPPPERVRAFAVGYAWGPTVDGLRALFAAVLVGDPVARRRPTVGADAFPDAA